MSVSRMLKVRGPSEIRAHPLVKTLRSDVFPLAPSPLHSYDVSSLVSFRNRYSAMRLATYSSTSLRWTFLFPPQRGIVARGCELKGGAKLALLFLTQNGCRFPCQADSLFVCRCRKCHVVGSVRVKRWRATRRLSSRWSGRRTASRRSY